MAKGRRATYKLYSFARKLEVIAYAKANTEAKAARHFQIPRTTIRAWKGLDVSPANYTKRSLKAKGKHIRKRAGRPLSYAQQFEEELVQWILESCDQQIPKQRKTIQHKALAIIKPHCPSFKASDGWLQKFMQRNSLSLRRTTSIQQKLPGNLERKLEAFMGDAKALREHHRFDENLIINMDETPIFFDMHHSQTVSYKGVREVRVTGTKGGKKRITFAVTCTGGGQMLKPVVIVKGKTQRTLKNISFNKADVSVVPQTKAWMDQVIMKIWIKDVLIPHTKRQQCLLVFDTFTAHLTDEVTQELQKANATVLLVPGGCTSKIQPVDVSLNKPIKQLVRNEFESYLTKAITESQSASIPSPTTTDVIRWIVKANNTLNENPESVAKSFKVCGISNALDGSENAVIRCAAELPDFQIPYSAESESDIEDIFDDSDSEDDEHECTSSEECD